MAEQLSFKHFYTVEYRPGEDELINYRAYKRRRHMYEGESAECECVDCNCDPCECSDWRADMGPGSGGYSTSDAESLGEKLSISSRLKLSRSIRRNKAKIAMGRKRAARRFASKDVLDRRARKAAYKMFYKKITKGIPKDKLSPQRKQAIEDRLKKPAFQGRINKISRKLVKDVRKKEMARKRA